MYSYKFSKPLFFIAPFLLSMICLSLFTNETVAQERIYLKNHLQNENLLTFKGIASLDLSGWFVSDAGDINNDGYDDVVIGARFASPNGMTFAGQVYVLLGNSIQTLELKDLNGISNGFIFNGNIATFAGYSVTSAGDIDADGISDLVIGARDGRPFDRAFPGEAFIVFGNNNLGATSPIPVSTIDSPDGLAIFGARGEDGLGNAVHSAGDVNSDGYDDVLIGASLATVGENDNLAGKAYLLYGGDHLRSIDEIDLLDQDQFNDYGIIIHGEDRGDLSSYALSSAGDINNDGYDDILIGAIKANNLNNGKTTGKCYLIFGSENLDPVIDLKNLTSDIGFEISGLNEDDKLGFSVSNLGDVNGDSVDDFIIGAIGKAAFDGENIPPKGKDIGRAYVIFGRNSFPEKFDLQTLNGNNGFEIRGEDKGDMAGWSVSNAGDVNKDGLNDILISAPGKDDIDKDNVGSTYIIFGKNSYNNIEQLGAAAEIEIIGENKNDFSGWSVSTAGDVNSDGYDEVIIGAAFADPNNIKDAGSSYLLYVNKEKRQPEDQGDKETQNKLLSIYPNPSTSGTTNFQISTSEFRRVKISIYTIDGKKIATVVNKNFPPGQSVETWKNSQIANGLYFIKTELDGRAEIQKMLLMRQ